MKRRIADHLTYANVVSTLCLFVLLGGGAYAATKLSKDSVGSKQVKNEAIRGVDVRDDGLTGADIEESSLDAVPDAANAGTAANAELLDGIDSHQLVRSFGANVARDAQGPIFYVQELDALLLGDTDPGGTSCFRIRHTGDFGDISVGDLAGQAVLDVPALHTSPNSCEAGPLVLTNTVHPNLMLVFGCAKAARNYCYGQLMEAPPVDVDPLKRASKR